ncbi:formimidoylglutamate deiminase [Persicimonas caeni]|uniref:Formimidoylglutamate deiminase n=2 Tax=Persicimonas caeni TaxID=2292766 RepID=A0A4Y6PWB1_PERCE|nr:formimidoylglutamate deiminase [Persicimonas caeni]QED33246.1 formimidoylglutamate deiminase [Persicimonas caeni]
MQTSMNDKTYFRARYILDGFDWVEDGYLEVENGRVGRIYGTENDLPEQHAPEDAVDLGEVAVVPGLVNAHSHAFQRGIRGKTEYLIAGREEEDFWTWRDEMYRAALGYDADKVEEVSRLAFLEMAMSGITSVGEFHYLHHQPDGTPYADPNELAHRVIRAARDVGIRITLLRVGYHRAGHGRPAEEGQRRFVEPDVDTYLTRADDLRGAWADDEHVTVGLAPHSIRAVPREWLVAASDYADEHDLAFHTHACEQRREIEESREEYGKPPVAAFADMGILSERMTLVHGTHLTDEELGLLEMHRPTVCACPTTERNLGDGFLPALELAKRDVPISLGSDSHTNIDLWEEMRLVEYHERLRYERRNVLATEIREHMLGKQAGDRLPTANALWPMGTLNGARSLGLSAGCLEPGCLADFVTIDLNHITLRGTTRDSLLADITLSMTPGAVKGVFVGGEELELE